MSRKFRVNASRKPVKCADAGSDVYFVVLDSAGNIVSTSVVDADIADRTARQLRSGGRKVRKFTNEADYNAFLDKCDESRRENSRMSKKSVGASTKRKSTVQSAWISHGKKAKIRSTYKTDDNYMMFEVGDDFIGISVNNSWPNGEAWISTHVVTCDDAEALFNWVKDAMEQHPEWSVITALKKSGYEYKITSFPGISGYDVDRRVGASTRPTKRKSTIKASAGDDYITITFLYNGNSDDERAKAVTEEAWRLGGFGSTGTEHGKATVMVPPDQDVRKIEQLVLFAEDQGIYLNQYSYNLLCDKFQFDKYLRDDVTGSKSVKCSARPTKRKSTIKATDESQRFVARQRTALDGKTWWYVFDTKENKWSTKMNHGKYKTKKECEYAISRGIESAKSVKCSARPAKRKTTIKADTDPYNFSRDDRYALAGEVLYRAGIANNEHGAAVAYNMPGDYVLTFNHEQNEMQSSDLIFTLWNPGAEHENDFAGILYVDLNSAQSGEDDTEVFYRPNGLGSLGEWKQFDNFKSAVDWLIANAPDRELFRVDSSQDVECSEDIMCWVDPAEARFMVDLMYGKDSGYAEDIYTDDWSEVESFAHDGLMRGLYARIWDKETGDTITISPDEYAEAWENGAADFGINEDIVNFKNRVVTSSTKIQCDDWSDGTYCIVYNGKVIAETDGLYNGLDDCGEGEIAEILLMDDAALKACADYVNSFGDPVLTGDEVGDANEVAMVLAEIISDDYAEYKSDTESFGDSISWDGNILEWFDSSDLADDVTSSTKIEAFRDDTVDETAVRELVLVITDDGDLYRQRTTPIIENLKKKAAKGTYDREKAVKLWQYLADDGVRMYDKEYGSGRGSVAMLNPATRRRIAEELRDYYEEEIMWDINHSDDDSELTTM